MNYLIYASLFGGVLTLAIMRYRTMPLPALLSGQDWAIRLHRADQGVPYGIALAGAALAVYPQTVWMRPLGLG
jgi:prepilin peptidase CpaA